MGTSRSAQSSAIGAPVIAKKAARAAHSVRASVGPTQKQHSHEQTNTTSTSTLTPTSTETLSVTPSSGVSPKENASVITVDGDSQSHEASTRRARGRVGSAAAIEAPDEHHLSRLNESSTESTLVNAEREKSQSPGANATAAIDTVRTSIANSGENKPELVQRI